MADFAIGQKLGQELCLCLAFEATEAEIAALRLRLLAGGWVPLLGLAERLRLLPSLALAAEAKGLMAGIPLRRMGAQVSVPTALGDALAAHAERQAILLRRLEEMLELLAQRHITPLLLKGAKALWTGTPGWRTLRDLDLLVPPPALDVAIRTALDAGFHPNVAFAGPASWHHGAELYRDDLPGWIEFHGRSGVLRMERLLPTAALLEQAVTVPNRNGRTARVLPPVAQLLHCMLHHHVGHRGDYDDEMDLKGLYEFAADVAALSAPDRTLLWDSARAQPRLIAILDLWLAAAADMFRLRVEAPLRLAPDAQRAWQAMKAQAVARATSKRRPRRLEGLGREMRLALAPERLRLSRGGGSAASRMALRLSTLHALLSRPS